MLGLMVIRKRFVLEEPLFGLIYLYLQIYSFQAEKIFFPVLHERILVAEGKNGTRGRSVLEDFSRLVFYRKI